MSSPGENPRKILTWAVIDLKRLRQNLRAIRSKLDASRTEVLAVVKADAYGHGMKRVALTLKAEGVRFFGVANVEEALDLREVCPEERILVLGGFHPSHVNDFIRHRLTPTVSSLEDAQFLEASLGAERSSFPIHVKIDTGMGRLGVWHEEVETFFSQLKKIPRLAVEGVYTHLACADSENRRPTARQLRYFKRAVQTITRLGFRPRYFHAANSMGLMRFKNARLNLARPGIVLYGINPLRSGKLPPGFLPVLSLKTCITHLKTAEKGRTVSYGGTYQTKRKTRIATLPVGYSHGYRVGFSNKAFVILRGRKCPVIGRVTMDQTLVDVSGVPEARRWDEVTLLGEEGKLSVSAADLARLIGSIPYEIVCAVHSRIPRIYTEPV
jgi:alanine racemase